jgi:hypothetical protein
MFEFIVSLSLCFISVILLVILVIALAIFARMSDFFLFIARHYGEPRDGGQKFSSN